MNKKRLLCIVLSLTAVIGTMLIRDSAAWINTKSGEPLPQTLVVNKMKFIFEGKLATYLQTEDEEDFIISGQNLIWDNGGKINGANYSNMKTNVRFRILYDTPLATNQVYAGGAEEHLVAQIDPSWTRNADGYYYRDFDVTASVQYFDIISDIHYNEEKVTRELYLPDGEAPFHGNVRVELQAKQQDNVDWTDIWTVATP